MKIENNSRGSKWTEKTLDWGEVVLLSAMTPLFVFPAPEGGWPFFVFALIWVARRAVRENNGGDGDGAYRSGTIIDAAVLFLAVQLFVSCFIVPDLESARSKIVGIVYGILVYYALARILRTNMLVKAGLTVFLSGGLALAVAGLTGMFGAEEPLFKSVFAILFNKAPRRNWGFPGAEAGLNPNAVAGVMMLFVPLCLVLTFGGLGNRKRGIAGRAAIGALAIFFLAVLFLTQSIGSWLSLAIGAWVVLPSFRAKALGAIPVGVLALLILIVLPAWTPDAAKPDESFLKSKIESRYQYWEAGIVAVKERPVTGIGANQLRMRPGIAYEKSHAHNQLLHTSAELGIPGLVAYLAILAGAMFACRRVWRIAEEGWMRSAARGLGAGQAAFFFFGMGDAIPLGAKPGIFFWVSLALIMSLHNLMMKSKEDKTSLTAT